MGSLRLKCWKVEIKLLLNTWRLQLPHYSPTGFMKIRRKQIDGKFLMYVHWSHAAVDSPWRQEHEL
jgi:hypothetical protein